MRLQFIDEPALSVLSEQQPRRHSRRTDFVRRLRQGQPTIPTPIRLGVVGTTATVDRVRDWLEDCKNGVASQETKLTTLRPSFPG
ncbi:hypothetical protein ACVWY5_000099 [Bradyrhizobium sp. USDA 3256]